MLFLVFSAGLKRYAIDALQVVEVLPNIRPQESVHDYSTDSPHGAIVLRGDTLPVIDLSWLLNKTQCPDLLSSRLILIESPLPEIYKGRMALLAEKLTSAIKLAQPANKKGAVPPEKEVEELLSSQHDGLTLFHPESLLAPLIDRFKGYV